MGDPETQPIMMRLKSDLVDVLMQATSGTLDQADLQWDRRAALGVVMAADGYPLAPKKGAVILGIAPATVDTKVFHAGTVQREDECVLVSGGRVLCVTALGETIALAQQKAYETLQSIQFEGAQYRSDIGWRAIKHR